MLLPQNALMRAVNYLDTPRTTIPAPGATDNLTNTITTTITTSRTIFPVTLTQYNDPFNSGRQSTVSTRVTVGDDIGNNGGQTQSGSGTTIGSIASTSTPPGTNSSISSAPATSSSVVPPPNPHPGLSSGAAAGIGIGCAIAGAAIAALIVAFCMRRRQRKHVRRSISRGPSAREKSYSGGHGGAAQTGTMMGSLSKSGPTATVEKSLEPPMQDSDIQSNMQRLGTAIKNHAQSYYVPRGSLSTGGANVSAERLATLLGSTAPVTPQELASMLMNPQSRIAAVRFLIAWSVLPIAGHGHKASLLPPELAESLETIKSGRGNTTDRALLLSRWRQMTAVLMHDTYGNDSVPPSGQQQQNVYDLVSRLDVVLAPLASSAHGSDADRRSNLEEIVKRAARFEYTLFTQPTEWDFSWDVPTRQRGDLVVFPAMLRTSDETGTRLAQPRAFGAPQVVTVASAR